MLDHSVYSDSNLSPSGIEWMAELPLASDFSFLVLQRICLASSDFYDPTAADCVITCPGGTRPNIQNMCV